MEDIDIIPPDDAEEVSPKFVLFYALEKKKSIIAEACTVDNSIKSITWKWWVQPNQICKWMRSLLEDEFLPQYQKHVPYKSIL